jgi:hypothetical protein
MLISPFHVVFMAERYRSEPVQSMSDFGRDI